ncbi:MAG: helix-turn-helix transcriptional regulator [Synechococcus sp.]
MSNRPASSPGEESTERELTSSEEGVSQGMGSTEPASAEASEGSPAEQNLSAEAFTSPGTGTPENKPVYAMSVAADLVNMHPQTLRQYERRGLLQPQRDGKNRLYSQNDIDRILYIQQLTQDLGVNLAGVEEISRLQLELERQKQKMQSEIQRLHQQIATLEDRLDEEGTGEVLEGRS